jgi:hypothetical protein
MISENGTKYREIETFLDTQQRYTQLLANGIGKFLKV